MSPGRVVDYPLGLRSQGPEFKSPSGRSLCGYLTSFDSRSAHVLTCPALAPLAQDSVRTFFTTTLRAQRAEDSATTPEAGSPVTQSGPGLDPVGGASEYVSISRTGEQVTSRPDRAAFG